MTLLCADIASYKFNIKPVGLKLASIAINHRLRISRLMVILHMMNNEMIDSYLESMDKVEAHNMLHLLQSLVVEESIIERFTYSTFEQVAYGIDTFHIVQKIKKLLREQLVLLYRHVCNHRYLGELLDSFF